MGENSIIQNTDLFIEEVTEVKIQKMKTKPRTYSLPDKHNDYIHQKAIQISQKRGVVVSASEALRIIIQEHSVMKKFGEFNKPEPAKQLNGNFNKEAKQFVAKGFTLLNRNIERINAVAMDQSQKFNRLVSASEALRFIIRRHEETEKENGDFVL